MKHWTGPAVSGGGVASVPMPTATSFASVLQQHPAPPMEVGHGVPDNPQVSQSLAARVAAFAAAQEEEEGDMEDKAIFRFHSLMLHK